MDKPKPEPNAESKRYWDAANEGKLIYQHCGDCGRSQYYPRALCSHCGSRKLEWKPSRGKGRIHAITRVHVGLPSFKADVPYTIVLVDVDEGFRMLTNLIGNGGAPAIGAPVELVFEERDGIKLPQFRIAP